MIAFYFEKLISKTHLHRLPFKRLNEVAMHNYRDSPDIFVRCYLSPLLKSHH